MAVRAIAGESKQLLLRAILGGAPRKGKLQFVLSSRALPMAAALGNRECNDGVCTADERFVAHVKGRRKMLNP